MQKSYRILVWSLKIPKVTHQIIQRKNPMADCRITENPKNEDRLVKALTKKKRQIDKPDFLMFELSLRFWRGQGEMIEIRHRNQI